MYAIRYGGDNAVAIINMLIEAGANPNIDNYLGDTPLFYVARHIGDHTDLWHML